MREPDRIPTIETRPNQNPNTAFAARRFGERSPVRPSPERPAVAEPLTLAIVGMAGYAVAFLTNVVLSRLMGSEIFGDYSVAFAVLGVLTSLALVGSDQAANRFIPHLSGAGDRKRLGDYLVWNIRWLFKPFLLVVALAAATLAVAALTDLLGLKAIEDYHLAVHAIWIAPLSAACLLVGSYFVALGHSVLGGAFRNLLPNASILVFILAAAWLLGASVGRGLVILVVWAVAFGSLLALQMWTLKRREPDAYRAVRAAFGNRAVGADPRWASTSTWMLGMTICSIVLWHLDLLIVEIVDPSEAETGYYAAIVIVARMLHLVPLYMGFMVGPRVGFAYDRPDQYGALQRAIDASNAIVAGVSVAVLGAIVIWGREILDLFGPGYRGAETALFILAAGVFVGGLTRQSRSILMSSGGERIVSRTSAAGLAVLIAGGIPATLYFSLDGMATVSAAVVAGQNLVLFAFAKRRLKGIRPLTIV
jgi:O-antigen/teichoic acid export membrane protein